MFLEMSPILLVWHMLLLVMVMVEVVINNMLHSLSDHQSKNESRISYLKRQLDWLDMQEEDNIVDNLTKVQDLHEQLLNIFEIISDKEMVSNTLESFTKRFTTPVVSNFSIAFL